MKWDFLEYQTNVLYQLIEPYALQNALLTDMQRYASTLYYYLISDTVELKKWSESFKDESSLIAFICSLRYQIRSSQIIDLDLLESTLEEKIKSEQNAIIHAESYFVAGIVFEKNRNFHKASSYFLKAGLLFEKLGLLQKSLKSYHNYATALSHQDSTPKNIQVYQSLYAKARQLGNVEIERMAIYNISIHFFNLGSLNNSSKYIRMALNLFENFTLNRDHYLCLLHKCRLQQMHQSFENFQTDLELCLTSNFADIKRAAEDLLLQNLKDTHTERPASWETKSAFRQNLTEAESQLLDLLIDNPLDKYQIIDSLFDAKLDYESALNRLNNLISRLRKKTDISINLINGKYVLSWSEKKVGS